MMQVNWKKEINSGLSRMYRATLLTIMISLHFHHLPGDMKSSGRKSKSNQFQMVISLMRMWHTPHGFLAPKKGVKMTLSEKLEQIEEAKVIEKHDTKHIIKTLEVPNTDLTVLFEDYQCLMITVFPILEGE